MILNLSKYTKGIALYLAISMLFQIFYPGVSMALTSGPSQPEVQSFEPVTTNQMVDPFTGDFTYNIPLFNLPGPDGGYPFNLAYHSGIGMDQEASWVGLGWSLNPGVINRDVRNLPDDFDGTDKIAITEDLKTNWTLGASYGLGVEAFGFDSKKGTSKGSFNLSAKVYYNSYKGVGYGLGGGLSHRIAGGPVSGGLNVSLDSQEGVGANPSLSIQTQAGKNGRNFSAAVSTGYNSRIGLTQTSIGLSINKKVTEQNVSSYTDKMGTHYSSENTTRMKRIGGNASIAVANNSYSPSVTTPFNGFNVNISYKTGADFMGAFGTYSVGGFYNQQNLKHKAEQVSYPAVGYLNLDKVTPPLYEGHVLSDIGREKDGMVHRTSELLATPSFTHDSYTVLGQGIANTYRPFRSDLGIGTNQYMKSKTKGGNIGFEFGVPVPAVPPTTHSGLEVGYNWSKTTSGKWKDNLDLVSDAIGFKSEQVNTTYEPYYFKTYGEHTADDNENRDELITSKEAAYFQLESTGWGPTKSFKATNVLKNNSASTEVTPANNKRENRRPKGVNLIPITNNELLVNGEVLLPEYKIQAHPRNNHNINELFDLSRTANNHIGGYTALNNSGQRYVYGLPALNTLKKEVRFSLDPQQALDREGKKIVALPLDDQGAIKYKHKGTDKRFYEMQTPAYAHSYLLTSILGADYVDIDNNGPSENDLGYWVKFNYVKTSNNYKWRAPFSGANFIEGYKTSTTDDQGAYMYGEKEIWHVATVETKTHVAEFILGDRFDAKGVASELQNDSNSGASSYRLKEIKIYTKAERYAANGAINHNAIPIKTVHLKYNYDLCKGVPNNPNGSVSNAANRGGKLTLEELWFTYKNNKRGELNKYRFDYHASNPNENPNYKENQVDKWGNYQPNHTDYTNQDNPYVHQFDANMTAEAFDQEQNRRAGVWNLKGINLPSGGRINIDYEADRYAYIQDQVAMQMTPIAGLETLGASTIDCKDCGYDKRKVYFELEHPVSPSELAALSMNQNQYIREHYIENGEDLYFKIKSKITNPSANLEEYVGGYSTVHDSGLESDGTNGNNYTHGWVRLDFLTVGTQRGEKKLIQYHPFQLASWQHIRTNQPELLYEIGDNLTSKEKLTTAQITKFSKSLGSIFPEIIRVFKGVYTWLHKKKWGSEIVLNQSFIRLKTPDKEKFGGGCRVREISITDNWNQSTSSESSETYGQRYFYTTKENGKTISSGVAAYEPVIGGDEIALRKPVRYALHTKLKTDNNMYSELPVNENLYPGPQVGYSKVTVMSMNTDNQRIATNPETNSTTGKVVNAYYTAKDFPVQTDKTALDSDIRRTRMKHHLVIPVPGIGSTTLNKLAATQGYSIVLNDMHGKLKRISNYGQDDNGNFVEDRAVSSVEYIYKTNHLGELDNKVTVINTDNGALTAAEQETTKEIGVDTDFITDMRRNMSISGNIGVSINFEALGFLPAFVPWPSISYNENQLKTVVTNKVIHQSGILIKTIATDGQSVVATENLKFDPLTGEALLTKTTNNFDEGIYNYNIPARFGFEGMGAAYDNLRLKFDGTISPISAEGLYQVTGITRSIEELHLFEGDELIGTSTSSDKVRFTYLSNKAGQVIFHSFDDNLSAGNYEFMVIRSGNRNHLTVKGASYVTLAEDPTENRTPSICLENLEVPLSAKKDGITTTQKRIPSAKINKVLSASATTFTNQWIKDFSDYRAGGSSDYQAALSTNPFATGEKGIWSAHKTYTYVDQRQQTPSGVNLSEDGIFNGVSMYNWDYTTLANCNNKWKLGSEITKMNPYSLETENRDVLGRYSAALYGYGGRQATAVAANAQYNEIGFEGFEEYSENQSINQYNATTGNLSFYTNYLTTGGPHNNGDVVVQEQFDVLIGQSSTAVLDMSLLEFQELGLGYGSAINLTARADKSTGASAQSAIQKVTINGFEQIDMPSSKYDKKMVINFSNGNLFTDNIGRIWTGKAGIYKTIGVPNNLTNNSSITTDKAHTGKHSLKVVSNTVYQQSYLNLTPQKKYELSLWVSKKLAHYKSLSTFNIPISIVFLDINGNSIGTPVSATSSDFKGQLINGWQKVDLSFTPPANSVSIELRLGDGLPEAIEETQSFDYVAYFDDIRIFPSTGLMKSHVYDPLDLKLSASLDDNNYATFYYYDESGSLFLVKQETAEGIKTIQESRAHLQE